jgi:hypothetical protein
MENQDDTTGYDFLGRFHAGVNGCASTPTRERFGKYMTKSIINNINDLEEGKEI